MMKTGSKHLNKYLILTILATGQGAVYFLPYLRNVYYTPLLETLQCTNEQLGSLVSFFAMGCMLLYIPGGIMTDRWSYKKCVSWSLITTGLLVGFFAFFMNFTVARIVYFLLAFSTTFVFWSANLKAVRALGDEDNQGKTYGFFYSIQGLIAVVFNNIWLWMFNAIPDPQVGLRAVLLGNAALNLLSGIACLFVLQEPAKEPEKIGESSGSTFQFSQVFQVLKNPLVWIIAALLFCTYGLYSNTYYYSNYLVEVKGLSQYWGSQLSLIRVTYMMCVASYVAGFFADKLKSTTKMFIICGACAGISAISLVFLLQTDMSAMALGILTILPAAFMLGVYGLASSLYEEYKIPLQYTGTAIGICSLVGYMPDLLFGPFLGGLLDKQGQAGYISIFWFYGILAAIIVVVAVCALILKKKRVAAKTSAQ